MIIKSISLCNFGVYSGVHKINLAYDSEGRVVTLIGGLNGRGKTSILEALLLAFYGNRSPKVRESGRSYSIYLADLIHGRGIEELESWVLLELELPLDSTVTNVRLKRSWGKKNVRVTDFLQVWRDEREDPYLAENWDSYVEELVPSAIAELFFFDGERISTLAESDETVESLRKAIQSLLGIETIDRLTKDLDLLIKRNRTVTADTELKDELQEVKEYLQSIELKYSNVYQERGGINSKIQYLTQQLEQLKKAYNEAGGGYFDNQGKLLKRQDELYNELDELKLSVGSILAGAFPLIIVEDQVRKVKETAKRDLKNNQAKVSLSFIKNISSDIMSSINTLEIDSTEKDKVQQLILSKIAGVEQSANEEPLFPSGLTMSNQLENILGLFISEKTYIRELISRYEDIDHELYQIEKNMPSDPDVDALKDLLEKQKEIEITIVAYSKAITEYDEEMRSLKIEEQKAKEKIVKMSTIKAEADETERLIKYAFQTQLKMKVFRDRLTQQKVNKLAEFIYEAFNLLTHKSNLVSKVSVDSENFKIKLYDISGAEISKFKLSSGERQMLALAILWGLAKASGKTLPVVIDTPMGRLDSLHRINFVGKYLPNASHQVVVLSTDTEIEGRYLQMLSPYVGKKYLLVYDETKRATEITEGYLQPENEMETIV
ncbi:DNA sulfur modification protein DndD [Paenibacillus sp. LHD-117]|uniref:DNA sulfur modification protein DndD n=1 Tax=Paenibacillus sp. LHD-117 TaxID=3071412 RepID=UPI0027DEB7A3|nr:DNA sulfur modification protein DndD [Paenibacillus sp. LHD-117]MDQ6423048.1 DNA sulfur modification protein DndD [Paenibacillus sp. LHD-117]